MITKNLLSFGDFIKAYKKDFPEPQKDQTYFSDILFRGQGDAGFTLQTTLERFTDNPYTFYDYLVSVDLCHDEVAAFTGKRWYERQEAPKIRNPHAIADRWELLEFMIYLRHYGFPSPLLDWTFSPYIAAYFAYSNREKNSDVAIYAFMEEIGSPTGGWVGEPQIYAFGGRSITADKRHHTQQARYSMCYQKRDQHYVFSEHEKVFVDTSGKQNLLVKYVLPGEQSDEMLERLNLMNINAYTLFQNEEGLANYLAFKNLRNPIFGNE